MLKSIAGVASLVLFLGTLLFTMYSFVFPFAAGDRLQGGWFVMIFTGSPAGIGFSLWSLYGRPKSAVKVTALLGHIALLLFLILYMTVGYLILGV